MSKIDEVQKYLKKTFERLEVEIINSLPNEHYQKAILGADFIEIEDLTQNTILDAPYTKGKHLARAKKAYIDNVSIFIKAKRTFENGDIRKTIKLLFIYHFQLGQIQQNITEEDGFKAIAAAQTTPGRDERYSPNRQIRAKACTLLHEHKPENGWENIPIAAHAIFHDLEQFTKELISRLDKDCNVNPENILNLLDGWMRKKENEVRTAFIETASQEWINSYVKDK